MPIPARSQVADNSALRLPAIAAGDDKSLTWRNVVLSIIVKLILGHNLLVRLKTRYSPHIAMFFYVINTDLDDYTGDRAAAWMGRCPRLGADRAGMGSRCLSRDRQSEPTKIVV
jgi:hypothetical protein